MIDFKKGFVDTAPFIYFIEKDENNPQYYEKVKAFFKYGYDNDRKFVSSVITMEASNEPILLHVAKWNEKALKLYEKVGFDITNTERVR